MFDHDAIAKDVLSGNLRQEQIAKKYGCSRNTVVRVIRERNIYIGIGIRYHWCFSEPTQELAYLIGMYLSEGYIGSSHTTRQPNQLNITNSSKLLLKEIERCVKSLGLKPRLSSWRIHGIGQRPKAVASCYSVQFVRWLYDVCLVKDKIPEFLFTSNLPVKLAFLSGLIDGDGSVKSNGCIRIRVTQNFIKQLPQLLGTLNIRSKFTLERTLDSGKPYYCCTINRQDFRALGGTCFDPLKRKRILVGKERKPIVR